MTRLVGDGLTSLVRLIVTYCCIAGRVPTGIVVKCQSSFTSSLFLPQRSKHPEMVRQLFVARRRASSDPNFPDIPFFLFRSIIILVRPLPEEVLTT